MAPITQDKEYIIQKLDKLPPELLQEVIDFVEFLLLKKGGVDNVYLMMQQENLEKIWTGDAEDLYEL